MPAFEMLIEPNWLTKSMPSAQAAIGNALRADIHATGGPDQGHADQVVDSFEECAALLREQGYDYDAGYLRQLYRAAATKAP